MPRRGSSPGFFGRFGRSEDLRRLDAALRAAGLHPALVPEGAKLALVNLMKDRAGGNFPPPEAYQPAAELFAFCLTGPETFGENNGQSRLEEVERRMEAALAAGEGADAEIVLLALHAGLVSPVVVDRYDLRAEEE